MSEFLSTIRMRTWAEIDLDNIKHNFNTVRSIVGADVKLCCVVKANGYGHSAPCVSRLFESLGADYLAVSNIEEALQLRDSGISLPILILGYTPAECAKVLAKNNIAQCVYSYEYGAHLIECAKESGVRVTIHIKLDTGMGRIGFMTDSHDELALAAKLCKSEYLAAEGIFTHFAAADESDGKSYTEAQYKKFIDAIDFFDRNSVSFKIKHCANSAATIKYPEYKMDMVRAGLILYGLSSLDIECDAKFSLRPVMSLKSIISHVKTLRAGQSVSYGMTFVADHDMKVATVPVGYADGLMRSTANSDYTLKVNDKPARIIGRICMDQLMLDVSEIECQVGDVVTIFDGTSPHTANDLARANGTIPYEIICSVGKRVPRALVQNGKIVDWSDAIYQ